MNLWTILLGVVGLVQFIALAVFVANMRRAPEGFQDGTGYHAGRETFVPVPMPASPMAGVEESNDEHFGHAA